MLILIVIPAVLASPLARNFDDEVAATHPACLGARRARPIFALALSGSARLRGGRLIMPPVTASIPIAGTVEHLGGPISSVFSTIGGAVLGAFSWTVALATKFICSPRSPGW